MSKPAFIGALCAFAMLLGCEDITRSPESERADEIGEIHEEAAERRASDEGKGLIDREIAGEVARERGELATEAGGGAEDLIDEPAQTAAQDLAEDDQYGKPEAAPPSE